MLMLRISDVEPFTSLDGLFTNGKVASGVPPTRLVAEWFNAIQTELINVVEGAGIVINPEDNEQVLKAINKLIQSAMPTIPVTSVNNKTGAVTLGASDVDAVSASDGGTFKGNVKFDGLDYLYKEKFNNSPADGSNSTLGLRLLGNGGQRSDDLFYEKIGVFAARRFFIASGNNSCNIDMRQDGSIVSQHGTGNYVIYPDGNISGNAWGGYLRDFINNKFNGAYSASNPPPIASQAVTGVRLSGRTVQPDSGGRIDLPAGCVFTGMSGANYNAGTWAAYSAVQININGVWATVATV